MNIEQKEDNRETGGHLHGLDDLMGDRNGDSFFGSLFPSLVLELVKPILSA